MPDKKEAVQEDLEALETEEEGLEVKPLIEGAPEDLEGGLEEEPEEGLGGIKGEEEPEEEAPKFKLSDTESFPEKKEEGEDEKIEIVHNGQVYNFTRGKIVELAQKGFDYDFKVGPHGKLAQLIDADPAISKVVNDYLQGRGDGTKGEEFKVTPIDDYDDETEWLQDNITKVIQSMGKLSQPTPKAEPQDVGTMADALRMRDPEFYDRIYPKLDAYAEKLTMAEYRRVDTDMGALCQFYDFVKEQELKPVKIKETKTPGFKVRSGGGAAPRSSDLSLAWNLSKNDFQKQLDKVKGYT